MEVSSAIKEFVIPLEKDELLVARADCYNVKNITPAGQVRSALDATRAPLEKDGPAFILQHFDPFFSVLVHANKLEFRTTLKAFQRILKGTGLLIGEMDNILDRGREIGPEERCRYLCITKMYAYLLSSLSCYLEDYISKEIANNIDNAGKKKKDIKKSDAEEDWEDNRQKGLVTIYEWLQLPLQKLWSPPIVEDLFITVIAQFCYKVLEQNRGAKQKTMRQTVFQILGSLVKRYNHGMGCVVRIIQLVKLYDTLAAPLATGVVEMETQGGCTGFIREIVREIEQGEPTEIDARNISTFLEAIAAARPDLILPILDSLTEYLANECYSMRNCAIGVIGDVVIGALTGENIDSEKREKRDKCLDLLEEHFLDINAYVRSRVLQVWQRLCCEGAIPVARQGSLVRAVVFRLEDKSANVRKQALQLLRTLLQVNPFAAKLDQHGFEIQLIESKAKLKALKVSLANHSTPGDVHRVELWNALLPKIRKAIKHVLSTENDRQHSSASSSDEEPEEAAEAPQIDPDVEFENVRQLLLAEEVVEAITHLKKTCASLPGAPDMLRLNQQEKEDCFFMFLLKIFGESQGNETECGTTVEAANDQSNRAKETSSSQEYKKSKEEYRQQRLLVNYIENCLEFSKGLEESIPLAEVMLFSTTASDAVEACTYLGTAYQFGVPKALAGIRKALFQVGSRDQSIRNNVATVYKEIYLDSKEVNQSARQKAVTTVNALLNLIRVLEPGQSAYLCQLISTWRENEELGEQELQIMWEKFSLKIPVTNPEDSRAALMLLTMVAHTDSTLFARNLDVLIKVGLGERGKNDLLLARDTCRALLKIKQDSDNSENSPLRYPNDHIMFEEIISLAVDNFTSTKDDGYISFVTDAINAIYHLSNQPELLIKRLLRDISEKGNFFNDSRNEDQCNVPIFLLSRFLFIVGHVAIRQMVQLDISIYKELKRRNTVTERKKGKRSTSSQDVPNQQGNPESTPINTTRRRISTPASARLRTMRNKEVGQRVIDDQGSGRRAKFDHFSMANNTLNVDDNGEEILEGAAADDADAEFITETLENNIVSGNGMLVKFIPLVQDVCRYPEKYNDEQLRVWGVLALSKMMTISSNFCSESLQLLVTIMERSSDPRIRANALIGLCDLATRFPNQVEPWISHIYGRLRDDNVKVRSTCVRMLSNLIMREMVRVKGQVSGLALSIIDPEPEIGVAARNFFKVLSGKGNCLYNIMPDIISRLTDPELDLSEDDFQDIMRYILGLLQKERQIDTIIDKLCSRLKLATTERQWRDLSYCLSLLQFGPKSIRRLIESLPLLKEKIHHKQVLKSLRSIIEATKRKPDAKTACIELQEKIDYMLKVNEEENGPIDDSVKMPPPPVRQNKHRRTTKQRRSSSSDDDGQEEERKDSDSEKVPLLPRSANNRTPNAKKKNATPAKKQKAPNRKHSLRESNSGSDSGEEATPTKIKPSASRVMTPKPKSKRTKKSESPAACTPKRTSARLSKSTPKHA